MSIPSSFLLSIPDTVVGDLPVRRLPRRERQASLHDPAVETGSSFAPMFQRLSVGDRVFHAKFGDGVVDAVADKADDQEVTVTFKRHGTKRLMASLANLTVD